MLKLKYFVLKPRSKAKRDPHARASREAMIVYANVIRAHDPELCKQLILWAEDERTRTNALDG